MSTLAIGVLGCAGIARRNTIPALIANPSVRLVAVASRRPERAEEFARQFGCEAVTGYSALLDRPDIDAVYIPLPPALHGEWVGKALAAGKHVVAEKPLATNLAEATGLVAAARTGRRLLLENFAFLHHSQHATVRDLVAGGAIGELRSVTAEFGFPPLSPTDIRYQPDLGGGALLDVGVYGLRAATLFLGPDMAVAGARLRMDPTTGVDIGGTALLSSPSGVHAQISFGFDRAYRCAYTLWGREGRITMDRAYSAPPGLRPVLRLEQQDRVQETVLPADTQFANIVGVFIDTILTGGDLHSPGEDILRQAGLVDAVRTASTLPGAGH